MRKEKIKKLCDSLRAAKLDMFFSFNSRTDYYDDDTLKDLRSAGFIGCFIGIESTSQKILDRMNKKANVGKYRSFLERCKGVFPLVSTSWMIGFPGETPQTAEESKLSLQQFIQEDLIQEAWMKMFVPYPGAPIRSAVDSGEIQLFSNNWQDYSRLIFPPAYQLETMSRKELVKAYVDFISIAATLFCKKIGRSAKDYSEMYGKLDKFLDQY